MSFEIKPRPNVIDTEAEVVSIIQENGIEIPEATRTTRGAVFEYNRAFGGIGLGPLSMPQNLDSAYHNIAVGQESFYNLTTGSDNIGIGSQSGYFLTSGNGNIGLGYRSNRYIADGSHNVAIGTEVLENNSSSSYNVGVGSYSLRFFVSGSQNIAIGAGAASQLMFGDNNLVLGYDAQPSGAEVNNEITLGNSSIATIRAQVTSITSLSDIRDKKNIESLTTGLDFINKLNPVKFDWNMRDGGKVDIPDTGFIAQELIEIEDESGIADYLKLTYRENPEKLEASYGRLIPILVKAIQDLSIEIENLKNKI